MSEEKFWDSELMDWAAARGPLERSMVAELLRLQGAQGIESETNGYGSRYIDGAWVVEPRQSDTELFRLAIAEGDGAPKGIGARIAWELTQRRACEDYNLVRTLRDRQPSMTAGQFAAAVEEGVERANNGGRRRGT